MNEDLFRYKSYFLTCALLFSYAFIHTKLTGVFIDTDLKELINFSARMPFGQRMLASGVAHLLSYVLPFEVEELFFVTEVLFISLFYFALTRLLGEEFNRRQSTLLSWLFILLLPIVTVINYRFTTDGEATFFYPYDSASLFFMAAGLLFCIRSQWLYFILWLVPATFNRESSVLLVLMIPALHWQTLRAAVKPMLLSMVVYILTRLLIFAIIHHLQLSGQALEWYFRASPQTFFEANLSWLLNGQHIFLFLFCFAGFPLFWFVFYDYIPVRYRPLRYVVLSYFLGLLLVGNFTESRIFTEIIVLLYLPVCLAVSRWMLAQKPFFPPAVNLLYYVNRYAVIAILILVVLLRRIINPFVILLSNYF
ncbi:MULTISPECIES: hypothetical protein [unclassified Legionella]|uniref:hypothetical protein n=1 Tax=unclassified Legionella TaxID=2622702 RepID=UPI001055BE5C|nr:MULTISPECIES: hypothetical protein [unclassified Legionella]MDI9818050.1 hypothetical protein [Legionella sp. PL877]